MIRSITNIRLARDAKDFDALVGFFDALGLERGDAWKDKTSRGILFNAPLGSVGIVEGKPPADAYLMIEVSDLDSVHAVARRQKGAEVSGINDTTWGSRVFYAQPAPGVKLAFWQYLPEAQGGPALTAGKLDARGARFGIVLSRFNSFITERLLAGALDALRRCGARQEDITIARVPGAFEIPAAARMLAETKQYDAILCLGCILRGETSHYQHLSDEVTRGIGQSAQETGVPHALGVLTCDTLEQAIERAGLKGGNKGYEAGQSAVEMASLRRQAKRKKAKGKTARAGRRR